jgi:hypothetical protein
MTYIPTALQKDLYVKRKFSIFDSTTPWTPKVNITLTRILIELKDTATGTGASTLRIWGDRGTTNQVVIFDASFSANEALKETGSSFSHDITAGTEITYSVTQITDADPGGEAIISFLYKNQ